MPNKIKSGELTQSIGVTGLSIWSGILQEEYLPALKGQKAYKVYQEMADDTVIATLLDSMIMPLLAAEFEVTAVSEDKKDQDNADFIWDCMMNQRRYTWRQHVLDSLSMLVYGWSGAEVILDKRSDGKLGLNILDPRDQNTLYEWIQDNKGNIDGMKQQDPNSWKIYEIPLWKMIHHTFRAKKRSPEGTSPMRSLYSAYYKRKNLEVIECIGIERDATGVPVLKLPYNAGSAEKAAAEQLVKNLRNDEEMGIVLPPPPSSDPKMQGWDISLLGGEGSAGKQYDVREVIRDYNKQILMRFFAQFLILGMEKGGTQALVKGSQDFFSLALKSIQQEMLETWNNQLVPLLIKVNNMESPNGYPEIDWADPGKADVQGLSTLLKEMTGVNIIRPDDAIEDHVRALAGLPDREEGTERVEEDKENLPFKSYAMIDGVDGRDGHGKAIALTNDTQRDYLEAIDKWTAELENDVKPLNNRYAIENLVNERLTKLLDILVEIGDNRIREGWELGHSKSQRGPGLASKQLLEEKQRINRQFLTESFIPDLREKIMTSFPEAYRKKFVLDTTIMVGSIATMRARLGGYSGAIWEAIWSAVKISGQEDDIWRIGKGYKPKRVRWELDFGSQHCMAGAGRYGCVDLAREYESWDAMPTVPGGNVTCLTNCRCTISIQEDDGTWRMGI